MSAAKPQQTIDKIFQQAAQGNLAFEVLRWALENFLTAKNGQAAVALYTAWYANARPGIRVPPDERARVQGLLLDLKAYQPGLPDLPEQADHLRMEVDGQPREFRDITDPFFISVLPTVQKHTLTTINGPAAPWALFQAVEYVVRHKIPGDLVECGVWSGGSILLIAQTLVHLGVSDRRIYLYDTFEGMPRPDDVDRNWDGRPALPTWEAGRQHRPDRSNWGFGGTLDEVRRTVFSSGYPQEQFVFVQGLVEETIPATMPAQCAILRLDTDFYSSTYHELKHLYPILAPGGVLMIDDYGYYQGARLATDQFLAETGEPLYLSRVDESVRSAIKPMKFE